MTRPARLVPSALVALAFALASPGSAAADAQRPGNVMPDAPAGWISDDELPYRLTVSDTPTTGPSGLAGFALTVSADPATRPCPTGTCGPGETYLEDGVPAWRDIGTLTEGVHWAAVVAVSGAGLASPDPGRVRLRVDRTVPQTSIHGVPAGWSRQPVTLEARATDSGSGMVAKPGEDDGDPVTAIVAEGQPARVAQGASAELRLSNEGVTRVRYWARDLAGNANDGGLTEDGDVHPPPGETTVRIDRRSPVVSVDAERDPADPERLTASVDDAASGVASGIIGYRPAKSDDGFTPLVTGLEGSRLVARLPSDDLPRGAYEIEAEATDRAGNAGRSTDSGEPFLLEVPLKDPTRIELRFRGGGEGRRAKLKAKRPLRVTGTVSTTGGAIFAGVPVRVEELFDPGSRRRRAVTRTTTDRTGRFTARLHPGPTRIVRARFAGTRTARPASSRRLRAIARDRVRFQVTPALLVNGDSASMNGRVTGRGGVQPRGGKLVAIQYFDPGRNRWRPVEVIRADRRGRFTYRYRFRTIAYAQKILFRAVSLPEAGWPFETTASNRRPVVVYPSG